jgi:hypothetical protein
MRNACCFTFVLLAATSLIAQERGRTTLRTTEQTKEFTIQFLNTMATGITYQAFELLKTAKAGADPDIDATRDRTQEMLEGLRLTYGKAIGYDLLAERTLGATIIRYEALLKLEKYPVRCTVTYYRATDTWVPVRVWFDEDIDSLFIELGR